jgi:hypothetical protein
MARTGTNPDGSLRVRDDQLARQVFHLGPPVPPTTPGGPGCSSAGPTSPQRSMWPTARPTDENMDRRSDEAMTHECERPNAGQALALSVRQWQTPATDSFRSRGGDRKNEQGLDQQARLGLWPTVTAHARTHTPRQVDHGAQLANVVDTWQTPHGFCNTDRHGKTAGGGGEMAKQAMHQWATPQANADAGSRNCEGSAAHQGTSLADQVTTGSSETGRKGNTRRLNPRFVAWLCAFDPDWCAEIPRTSALRCYGNSVVWPQGAYAIAILWHELTGYLASRDEATA